MTIDVVFTPPQPEDTPEVFNTKAFDTLGKLNTWSTQANTLASEVSQDEVALAAAVSSATASASTATTKASEASASAAAAASSASTASTAASNAASAATTAAASASDAATSASYASGFAASASTNANTAISAANSANAAWDSFDDRYLGPKASDPTLDNDGQTLLEGTLYWNTVAKQMRTYNGSGWEAAYLPASGYVSGPASATDSHIALFDGTTGKIIKSSGISPSSKQDALVSGTNIKTLNGNSLLGSGNIVSGDVTGAVSSVDGEVALFSGTDGKTIKRATGSGLAKLTSGVLGSATPGTDYEGPIAEGTTAQYWRGDKSWRDLFTDVRATTLTGLSTATNAVIAATDTVLAALGKLQAQIGERVTGQSASVDGEVALFSGTGGKTVKRATGSGLARLTNGVLGIATAGTDYAKPDTASSWTAQQTFKEVKDTVFTITDAAGFQIDPANGSIQTITLGASRTPAATNFESGQAVLLGIDDGAAYSITWATVNPTWVKPGGTASAPTLATTGYTWVLLWKVGSTIYAAEVGKP